MSTSPPTLLVMAAGMGSRYGGLKQIDPLGPGGEIVLDYSVYDAIAAGFNRVIFVIRKEIEQEFQAVVGKKYQNSITVDYAFQDLHDLPAPFSLPPSRKKPWGTAHAVLAARDLIDAPFAAINADDFYGKESFQVLADDLRQAEDKNGVADYAMVGFQLAQTLSPFGSVSRGVCTCDADHNLIHIQEHTHIEKQNDEIFNTVGKEKIPLQADTPVSMNMWGFTPSFMSLAYEQFTDFLAQRGHEEKSEFYIPAVVDQFISEGRAECSVLPTSSEWFGVTYQEDRPLVQSRLKQFADQGDYPCPLFG